MASLTVLIWLCSSLDSLVVTLAEITGLETLHARPRAAFDGTKTYGTFCIEIRIRRELVELYVWNKCTFSSHRRGKWRRISRGSVSAVRTMNSETPRLSVLVAACVTACQTPHKIPSEENWHRRPEKTYL